MTKSLESLRLAEAFFAERPELLSTVRAFLTEAWERWPETEVVTQKSQVTLRGPRPFCALSTHIRFPRMPGPCYVTLSLFLPLFHPVDLDTQLWGWVAEAQAFRNIKT